MVIIVIDNIGVAVNKLKKYAPIAGYFHGMKTLFVAAQLVERRTRVIHILYFTCGIKTIKDSFEPVGMLRLNSSPAPSVKKILQAFMLKRFYHSA